MSKQIDDMEKILDSMLSDNAHPLWAKIVSSISARPAQESEKGNISENITLIRRGNMPYRVSQLKQHFPDVADRLAAGEFKNVRDAERAAGLNVPRKLTKVERMVKSYLSLDKAQRAEFMQLIQQEGN